jgi:hypothetical protein
MMKEEEIRSAIEGMTRETVADALAIFLAEENVPSDLSSAKIKPDFSNFAQAIQYLQQEYNFLELDLFTTEADLVYVQTGDRKILLTKYTESSNEKKDHVLEKENTGRFSHLELGE